jgi:hypothetical protein
VHDSIKCEIDERVDWAIRGCRKCGKETRHYVSFMGKDFCETCIGIVRQCEAAHETFCKCQTPLVGSGEP